jgi:5'-nucleotidase
VWIVAPVINQSGSGGPDDFTTYPNLTAPSRYNTIPKGAPSVGPDPSDSQIWYYNGTPAACILVALDYVLPSFANFSVPDLVVAGPNYGTNLGPYVWTLAGTAGAAYTATARSIPAIAISASNGAASYSTVTNTTNEYTWVAELSAQIVEGFITTAPEEGPILPLAYGANVNIPKIGAKWTAVPIAQSRFTGSAEVDAAVAGDVAGTFTWGSVVPVSAGANTCVNGNCSLPAETDVVASGEVSISLYTIDYTAPTNCKTISVMGRLTESLGAK